MSTTINVTKEDIKRGEAKSCRHCPVAIAVQRQVRTLWPVSVTYSYIFLGFDRRGRIIEMNTPRKVQNFLFDFDNYAPVEPFSFELDVPPDLTRLSDS